MQYHDGRARTAAIIGGGLAGTSVARALVRRGLSIQIIEKMPTIAAGASGNPAGVLLPHVSAQTNPTSRFSGACTAFLLKQLAMLKAEGFAVRAETCGVLSLASDATDLARYRQAMEAATAEDFTASLVIPAEASDLVGLEIRSGGLWFPGAGWVDLHSLCEANLLSVGACVERLYSQTALRLERSETGLWCVRSSEGTLLTETDVVVLANGSDCKAFAQAAWFPLYKVRGQINYVESTAATSALKAVISYGGFVTPSHGGQHVVGASFDWKEFNPELRAHDTRELLEQLSSHVPAFQAASSSRGRVAFRATSPDSMPLIGAVPDAAAWEQDTDVDSKRRHAVLADPPVRWWPGLYASVGHGTRGLSYTALSAEILAALVCSEPLPVDAALLKHLSPARFLLRQLRHRNTRT